MTQETLKLTAILIMVGSILFAGFGAYKTVSTQMEKTSEKLEQVYSW